MFIHPDVAGILRMRHDYTKVKDDFIAKVVRQWHEKTVKNFDELNTWLAWCVQDAELINDIKEEIDKYEHPAVMVTQHLWREPHA